MSDSAYELSWKVKTERGFPADFYRTQSLFANSHQQWLHFYIVLFSQKKKKEFKKRHLEIIKSIFVYYRIIFSVCNAFCIISCACFPKSDAIKKGASQVMALRNKGFA